MASLACSADNCLFHFYLSGDYIGCPGHVDKCWKRWSNLGLIDVKRRKRCYANLLEFNCLQQSQAVNRAARKKNSLARCHLPLGHPKWHCSTCTNVWISLSKWQRGKWVWKHHYLRAAVWYTLGLEPFLMNSMAIWQNSCSTTDQNITWKIMIIHPYWVTPITN